MAVQPRAETPPADYSGLRTAALSLLLVVVLILFWEGAKAFGAANNYALTLGGTTVELIAYEGVPVDPMPRLEHLGYRMIALEVEDMQKASDYLKEHGVDIVWGPKVTDTYARAEIRDPNGYGIELRQWFR